MTNIEYIVFDFGGVIGLPHDQTYVDKMAEVIGVRQQEWLAAYFDYRPEYDRGITSSKQYWESILQSYDVALTDDKVQTLVELDFNSWAQPNEKTIEWINELAQSGLKLVLLSNINYGVLPFVEQGFGCLELFDKCFYSCDMKLLKPDQAIYQDMLDTLEVEGDKCIFIDDSLANVEGAISLGIKGVQFTDFETTKAKVEDILIS